MTIFVKISDLDNKTIENSIVIPKKKAYIGQDFINNTLNLPGKWIEAKPDTKGGFPPGPEFTYYDEEHDVFIERPYSNSWVFNEEKLLWEPPIPLPDEENHYTWNDEKEDWELIS